MKKIVAPFMAVALLTMGATGAFAKQNADAEKVKEEKATKAEAPIYPASGSEEQKPTATSDVNAQASITINWSIACYDPTLEDPYATAESTASEIEDLITAQARTFDTTGTQMDSKTSPVPNAKIARATAANTTWSQTGDYALGYHKWEKSGYATVEKDSSDTW